jgi:hypothetical protein
LPCDWRRLLSLSLFQTRSSLMNLSYYVQLEAKAAWRTKG